jgi:Uma2 family endonuclease
MVAALTIDERIRVPASAMTHEGFRAWATSDGFPEGLRATFVDREVLLDMSPESIESHNKVKLCIASTLHQLVKKERLGEVFDDGVLLTHEAAGLSSEPDTMFVAWATFQTGRARLVEKANRKDDYIEVVGSPDVVVEIVSDSSERKDQRLLREAYLRAEVGEYWLVDARSPALSFQIFVRQGGRWSTPAPSDAPQRSEVLRRAFALSRAKNPAGRWEYDLVAT